MSNLRYNYIYTFLMSSVKRSMGLVQKCYGIHCFKTGNLQNVWLFVPINSAQSVPVSVSSRFLVVPLDINECDPSSGIIHGCQGSCINFDGGYNCSCPKGGYLASNGKDCAGKDCFLPELRICQQTARQRHDASCCYNERVLNQKKIYNEGVKLWFASIYPVL